MFISCRKRYAVGETVNSISPARIFLSYLFTFYLAEMSSKQPLFLYEKFELMLCYVVFFTYYLAAMSSKQPLLLYDKFELMLSYVVMLCYLLTTWLQYLLNNLSSFTINSSLCCVMLRCYLFTTWLQCLLNNLSSFTTIRAYVVLCCYVMLCVN
jgi:hypothetical protein